MSGPNAPQGDILRGFEVVKLNKYSQQWDRVSSWRPTELAVKQAAQDLKWQRERNPGETYQLRAVVSVEHTVTAEQIDDSPLVMDADEAPAPPEE